MPSQPASAVAFHRAHAALLRDRSDELLRASVDAGDAGLWGETIRHATIDAAIKLRDEAVRIDRTVARG